MPETKTDGSKFEQFLKEKGSMQPVIEKIAQALEKECGAEILEKSLFEEPRFAGAIEIRIEKDYFVISAHRMSQNLYLLDNETESST